MNVEDVKCHTFWKTEASQGLLNPKALEEKNRSKTEVLCEADRKKLPHLNFISFSKTIWNWNKY